MSSWKHSRYLRARGAGARPRRAAGAVMPAPGFATYSITTPGTVTGDVVRVGDAIFVGQGAFGVGLQTIIRLDGGVATTIANGFNSLGGFAFDGAAGTLYAVDNNGNGMGAAHGRHGVRDPGRAHADDGPSRRRRGGRARGLHPSGGRRGVDGKDLLVTDAVGPGAGRLVRVSKGAVTDLIISRARLHGRRDVDGTRLLVGNSTGFAGSVCEYTLKGALVGPSWPKPNPSLSNNHQSERLR